MEESAQRPEQGLRAGPRVIAFAAAVLVTLLLGWYFLVLRQSYATLYDNLRAEEAAAIVEVLEQQGVPYRLASGGGEILVPASRIDAARLELASSELQPGGADGFELFNETDMGLTDFAQKIRYQRALQGELRRTILRMEGVADARVHISMPERALFRGERRNAEAAVTLVMRSGEDETPARVEGVQRLVAASVPDLTIADVVVLNGRGEIVSPRVDIAGADSLRGAYDPAIEGPSIDLVMEVMRAALPGRQFEVTIEPAAALAGADSAGMPQRIVTVWTPLRLGDIEMERAGAALRRAGIVDAETGGTLAFRIAAPTSTTAIPAGVPGAPAGVSREDPLSQFIPWIAGAVVALVLLAAFAFWWLLVRGPALAPEEHERFADQLKALLASDAETQDA